MRTMFVVGVSAFMLAQTVPTDAALMGLRKLDPANVLPLDQIAAEQRATVAEIIRDHTFHRVGKADAFPSDWRTYLSLLNEPALTLALWQDIVHSPARLTPIGPDRYEGNDGGGASAIWEFVLRSPRLHVLLCTLDYSTPRGAARLQGRLVLIVRSSFSDQPGEEGVVRHQLECFVKVDSRGWKAVGATFRPLIERVLEDQIDEAGWFVSLMARLVETYPDWATQIARGQSAIPAETRDNFAKVVARTRKPNASAGRPTLASQEPQRDRVRR